MVLAVNESSRKRQSMARIFWCLALAALMLWSSALHAQEQASAARLRDGDFWHFQVKSKMPRGVDSWGGTIPDGNYILRFSPGRLRAYQLVNNDEQILENSMGLLSLIGRSSGGNSQNTRLTATSRDLQFPLFVGKKWQFTYQLNIPRGAKQRNVAIQVVALERTETAAGHFQTFKIEKYVQWATASALWETGVQNVQSSYFYSPETKSIVKYWSESTDGATREIELVKFGTSANPN